ncbi:MAG: hypothetical protein K8T90_17840 [Planctomycetes bacterium]|nr:hypothetical protein [Planctomycetota bacterium]
MTTLPRHPPRPRATTCARPPAAASAGFRSNAGLEFAPPADPFASFDLDAESQRLRDEPAYARTGRNAITLSATHDHHIVLVAQRKGKRVDAHRTPSRVTIDVISGALHIHVGEGAAARATNLGPHGLVTIDHHVLHSIDTTADSVFLLTIAGALRSD